MIMQDIRKWLTSLYVKICWPVSPRHLSISMFLWMGLQIHTINTSLFSVSAGDRTQLHKLAYKYFINWVVSSALIYIFWLGNWEYYIHNHYLKACINSCHFSVIFGIFLFLICLSSIIEEIIFYLGPHGYFVSLEC